MNIVISNNITSNIFRKFFGQMIYSDQHSRITIKYTDTSEIADADPQAIKRIFCDKYKVAIV